MGGCVGMFSTLIGFCWDPEDAEEESNIRGGYTMMGRSLDDAEDMDMDCEGEYTITSLCSAKWGV